MAVSLFCSVSMVSPSEVMGVNDADLFQVVGSGPGSATSTSFHVLMVLLHSQISRLASETSHSHPALQFAASFPLLRMRATFLDCELFQCFVLPCVCKAGTPSPASSER